MMQLITMLITFIECWVLFTVCYALAKKKENGEPLIDKKLTVFTLMILAVVYFIINITLFI